MDLFARLKMTFADIAACSADAVAVGQVKVLLEALAVQLVLVV